MVTRNLKLLNEMNESPDLVDRIFVKGRYASPLADDLNARLDLDSERGCW